MLIQILILVILILEFGFIGIIYILFLKIEKNWKTVFIKDNEGVYKKDIENLKLSIDGNLNRMMNIIDSQNSLIKTISNLYENFKRVEIASEKELMNISKSINEASKQKNLEVTVESIPMAIIPTITNEELEKKLDSLLNSADFTESIWHHFSRPFDVCVDMLITHLGEHGIPMPKIEAFPNIKDNNPNFWTFMIVHIQNWKDVGRQFIIPRNFDRYDPLWHKHLFEVRGNVNRADNYIKGLVRCAIIMNGDLSGNIDKRLVELKGIISVD